MESAMDLSSTELVSLEDEQLDDVAGGCRWWRRRWRRRGWGFGGGSAADTDINVDSDVNVQLNIIVVAGNDVQAGGDAAIVIDADNAA